MVWIGRGIVHSGLPKGDEDIAGGINVVVCVCAVAARQDQQRNQANTKHCLEALHCADHCHSKRWQLFGGSVSRKGGRCEEVKTLKMGEADSMKLSKRLTVRGLCMRCPSYEEMNSLRHSTGDTWMPGQIPSR